MKYISQKICKIFKLDLFVSMLKFDFDIKKIVSMLAMIVVCYMVFIPTYNLIKRLFKKNNKKSCSETLSYRKYRNIESTIKCDSDSDSDSDSKSHKVCKLSKSLKLSKNKVDKVCRTFKITE